MRVNMAFNRRLPLVEHTLKLQLKLNRKRLEDAFPNALITRCLKHFLNAQADIRV